MFLIIQIPPYTIHVLSNSVSARAFEYYNLTTSSGGDIMQQVLWYSICNPFLTLLYYIFFNMRIELARHFGIKPPFCHFVTSCACAALRFAQCLTKRARKGKCYFTVVCMIPGGKLKNIFLYKTQMFPVKIFIAV